MIELKTINKNDPLKRNVEKQMEQEEFSPMNPPDAYSPPNLEEIPYEEMHPFLQSFIDEHVKCKKEIDVFEETLLHIQQKGINRDIDSKLSHFFEFFDNNIVKHNQREDRYLFPFLQKRLLEKGEHGAGPTPVTSVDMLEDDHVKILQLAAVVFNFMGLAMRLPDQDSRLIVLDTAIEQGKVLIEQLRLHIFREDNIVFPQAHIHLSSSELDHLSESQNLHKEKEEK